MHITSSVVARLQGLAHLDVNFTQCCCIRKLFVISYFNHSDWQTSLTATKTLYMCYCVYSCDTLISVSFLTPCRCKVFHWCLWERNRYNREERGERGEGDARHWRQQTEMEEKREGGGVWMNNLVPPFPLSSSLLSWGCCKHRGEERKKRDGERRKGKEERGGNKGRRGDKMRWKKKEEKRKGDEGRGSERRRGCCHLFSPQNKLCK